MAPSMREQYDRVRRWFGRISDDRKMEHRADVDRDSTTLRDAVRPAAVESDEEPATE